MKLKCIENRAPEQVLPIAVGDILTGVAIPGSQGFDILDKDGLEWFVEPYLGGYALLRGGNNFTTMQVIARFEEVATQEIKKPLIIQG